MSVVRFRSNTDQKDSVNIKSVSSCCLGEIIPLERLSNDAFSSMILGEGFGVIPSDNSIFSPVSGIVKDVSENSREVTVRSDDGFVLIVSVGSDIISMDPKLDVECKINPGDHVTQDTELWNIDIEGYRMRNIPVVAAVIVTDTGSIPSFNIRYGKIKQRTQPVMIISL